MADFQLTPAQAAAVNHRGGPLLISAGAGSGKTRVLVERLMDLVCGGEADIDRFLIITYTRAAAAELRSRILEALYARLAKDPGSRRLRRQTALVYQARIGTIHSFCAALLRENAQRCGLRPDFRQMDEGEQASVRAEVLAEVLDARYAALTEEFRSLADAFGAGRDDRALADIVLATYDAVQSHPDPAAWLEGQIAAPAPAGDAASTPWGALLLSRARARARYWLARMTEAASDLEAVPALAAAYGDSFGGTVQSLQGFLAALDRGWDAACAAGDIDFPRLKPLRGMGEDPAVLAAKAVRDACKARMKKVTGGFDSTSGELMADMAQVRPLTDALFRLVRDFAEAYRAEKARRAALDFSDLEHLTLELLLDRATGRPTAQALEVSRRYEEILVDEYQDCNRVQELIFQAASRAGQNLTMVGDVKQSIYRFRLADPSIFLEKYAAYADAPPPPGPDGLRQGRRVILSENFRSDAGILAAANDLFRLTMSRELGELDYGEQEALIPGPGAADTPDAFELRVAACGDGERVETEAEAVAARIEALLREGFPVADAAGLRPLEPGDVAILLRASRGRDTVYAAALEKRGIPAVCLKAGDNLLDRREVDWAVSLLQVIDNPRQDIPLIAALRSPVWRFTEDRLARVRCAAREGCFYDALLAAGETDPLCAAVLRQLADFRLAAAELPTDRLLARLYAATGLPAAAEAREPGASANLDLLLDYARSFEQAGYRGLYSFVERLRETAQQGAAALTTAAGGGRGVRVTTVHGSKGLEYPVVVLADLMKKFNKADTKKPLLIHPALGAGPKLADRVRGIEYPTLARLACAAKLDNESLSEELRVLYVAMTRARRKLIAFCTMKDPEKTRLALSLGSRPPLSAQALEDCASPGEWVLTASLALGEQGCWRWLPVDCPPAEAPEEQAAEMEVPPDPALAASIRAGLDWRYRREADTRLPSKLTATELKGGYAQQEAAQEAEPLIPALRPSDFRAPVFTQKPGTLTPAEKGTALHLAMQYADPDCCATPEAAAQEVARLQDRHMLTPAQAEAVDPAALSRYDQSALGRRVRAADRVHREFKFSLLVPAARLLPGAEAGGSAAQVLLQGVVDCWLETEAGITLIDFKTDRVTPATQQARAKAYAPQLDAYAYALETMTGKPVTQRIVYFFATGEAVEVSK